MFMISSQPEKKHQICSAASSKVDNPQKLDRAPTVPPTEHLYV